MLADVQVRSLLHLKGGCCLHKKLVQAGKLVLSHPDRSADILQKQHLLCNWPCTAAQQSILPRELHQAEIFSCKAFCSGHYQLAFQQPEEQVRYCERASLTQHVLSHNL